MNHCDFTLRDEQHAEHALAHRYDQMLSSSILSWHPWLANIANKVQNASNLMY